MAGFFETIGNALRAVGRGIGGMIQSAGQYFGSERVEKFGRNLSNACSNINRKVKEIGPVKQEFRTESVARIERIADILVEFSEDMEERAKEIENQCIAYVEDYFDSLMEVIKSNGHGYVDERAIKRMELSKRKIYTDIDGAITYKVAQKVSVDNEKCVNILKIADSNRRAREMSNFCENVVRSAVRSLSKKVNKALEKQNKELIDLLTATADTKEIELECLMEQLNDINAADENGEVDFSSIVEPLKVYATADEILKILN